MVDPFSISSPINSEAYLMKGTLYGERGIKKKRNKLLSQELPRHICNNVFMTSTCRMLAALASGSVIFKSHIVRTLLQAAWEKILVAFTYNFSWDWTISTHFPAHCWSTRSARLLLVRSRVHMSLKCKRSLISSWMSTGRSMNGNGLSCAESTRYRTSLRM